MGLKKFADPHSHNHSRSFCLLNRIWRRKFLLISILLIFLIITISLTNSRLNAFSSLFSPSHKFHSNQQQQQGQFLTDSNKVISNILSGDKENSQFIHYDKNFMSNRHMTIDNDNLHRQSAVYIHPPGDDNTRKSYIPKNRFVHLDLKGAPPKVEYLQKLFPFLRRAGANGILLEYEDTFPYDGKFLHHAVADNAYSSSEIEDIKRSAKENSLEIIPLVQTLGHLEFFLKLENYRHLREMDEFPQAVCPSRNETYELLTAMIDQIMIAHPDSKWLHIGCDEVYQIGICDLCKHKDRDELFLNHVKRIATYVKEKYNVTSIIWDDMLRQFSPDFVKSYDLAEIGVELMIWTYVDDIYRFIPTQNWMFYAESFQKIWGARAFGETLTLPNIKMHLDNNIAWLQALDEQARNFKEIRGLVITGWQRYDHLATLCELLPSGLPSLILDLLTATNGKYESRLLEKFHHLMNCPDHIANAYNTMGIRLFTQEPTFSHLTDCDFPGSKVFRLMQEFEIINKRVDDYLYDVTKHKAWLTDYNFRHNITNPWRIREGLQDYDSVMEELKSLVKVAIRALGEIYDESTVYEWIEEKLYPQLLRMEKFHNKTMKIQKLRVWPRRPIKPAVGLQRFIDKINDYE
ncbi:Hydrolase [Dermatophagoides pteronyssinus]|uniref:beta-N-acetylhexosaminidase n=1 Tax=Dermatophagoides pteronyssinus TaxID=6956 RepID=A0ABQ8JLD3_DERPT|nr:Hydrolase [Dermatophagoides pteronyssinus]